MFEHVIGGAVAERFDGGILLERPRHEDEWDFRGVLAGQFQGMESAEAGQGAVGENQVEVPLLQIMDNLFAALTTDGFAIDPVVDEQLADEFAIVQGIFQVKNSAFGFHRALWEKVFP